MLNGFKYITNTRFIVNLNETLLSAVRNEFTIEEDERILMLIE